MVAFRLPIANLIDMVKHPLAIFALVALLLFGCAPQPYRSPTQPVPSFSDPLAELAWTRTGRFAGSPLAVDDVVVSYFVIDQRLHIGAWLASDSTQLWAVEASPGKAAAGLLLNVSEVGKGVIAHLSAADTDGWAVVILRDAASGVELAQSQPIWATSRPNGCTGATCISGQLADGQRGQWVIGQDGSLTASPADYQPPNSRLLADRIFVTHDRPGELLGMVADGTIAWQRPYEEVFGAGASSDAGWAWRDRDGWPLLGQGSRVNEDPDGFLLTMSNVVALDPASGATRWQIASAKFCADDWDHELDLVVLCVFESGRMQFGDESTPATYQDLVVSLQGIDPQTGQTQWSVPLDVMNWEKGFGEPFVDPVGVRRLWVGGRLMSIDLETGEQISVPDGRVLPCEGDVSFEDLVIDSGAGTKNQVIGFPVGPCDNQGNQVEMFSLSALEVVGTRVGEVWVVITETGLQAYRG